MDSPNEELRGTRAGTETQGLSISLVEGIHVIENLTEEMLRNRLAHNLYLAGKGKRVELLELVPSDGCAPPVLAQIGPQEVDRSGGCIPSIHLIVAIFSGAD